jgi:hypothetical protein
MKPRIFIGCSTESLELAKAIQAELEYDAFTTIWTQDIFKLTSNALEDLIAATEKFNFAIFVFNPDDISVIRNNVHQTVRDNVIFELGLFLGKLNSRKKVFILKPRKVTDLHLPTDLAGILLGDYDSERQDNLRAAVGTFCRNVLNQINELKNNGILTLAGKWSERWWVEDDGMEPKYFENTEVTMEQFDNFVYARMKDNGRTYLFEGKIEQMRYVTGTWRDAEAGPTYSGAFQLLININAKTLYGRWIGFSASTNSINTGIWEWKRDDVKHYPSELKKCNCNKGSK